METKTESARKLPADKNPIKQLQTDMTDTPRNKNIYLD